MIGEPPAWRRPGAPLPGREPTEHEIVNGRLFAQTMLGPDNPVIGIVCAQDARPVYYSRTWTYTGREMG